MQVNSLAKEFRLREEQLRILRDISQSIGFAGDGEVLSLVIDGYVSKNGDIYELTPKGVMALEEQTTLALREGENDIFQ